MSGSSTGDELDRRARIRGARPARLGAGALALAAACAGRSANEHARAPAPSASAAVAPRSIDLSALPALPSERHGHRVELVGRGDELALLAFGGFDRGSRADDRGAREAWMLELGALPKGWRRVADMAREHAFSGSAVVDGSVYAIGGSVERYDRASDRWEELAPPETFPDSHFAAAAVGTRLYAIGGFPARLGGALAFDVATRAVVDVPEPPDFRRGDHFHLVAALAGELHVVGGLDGEAFEPTARHAVFDGTRWRAGPPPPRATWGKFAAWTAHEDELFVFEAGAGMRFDARAGTWRDAAGLDAMLAMPASAAVLGKIVVLGGMHVDDARRTGAGEARVYDPELDRWSAPVTAPCRDAR